MSLYRNRDGSLTEKAIISRLLSVDGISALIVIPLETTDGLSVVYVPLYNPDGTPLMGEIKTLRYEGELIWESP